MDKIDKFVAAMTVFTVLIVLGSTIMQNTLSAWLDWIVILLLGTNVELGLVRITILRRAR